MVANIDFANYGGAIGFQDTWMRLQNTDRSTLLQRLADSAIDKKIGAVVVLSAHDRVIEPDSIHDRWGVLREQECNLPYKDYEVEDLGRNRVAFSVARARTSEKEGGRVFIINGQFVKTDLGDDNYRPLLVVGANRFSPFQNPADLTTSAHNEPLSVIVHQDFLDERGRNWVSDNSTRDKNRRVDGVIGHYGLSRVPPILARGSLAQASKDRNVVAQRVARENFLPWVAGSGGKIPGQIVAYSTLPYCEPSDWDSEGSLLMSIRANLRRVVNDKDSTGYVNLADFFRIAYAQWHGDRARKRGDSTI